MRETGPRKEEDMIVLFAVSLLFLLQVENGRGSKALEQSIEYYKLVEDEERVSGNVTDTVDWKYDEFSPCSLTCSTGK